MSAEADLDACAREPIHIPGRVQSHGVLLALGADRRVRQASANAAALLNAEPDALLGRPAVEVLGPQGADSVETALTVGAGDDLQTLVSFPLPATAGATVVDAVVHRADGLILVELLRAGLRPRPVTFTDTYRRAQGSIARLDATGDHLDLLATAAAEVRRLTGFDRVMVYRFDADYNGEVIAEELLDGLPPFLGLHYPASDIPPQARALYERSWLRLIADVHGAPADLVPALNPLTEAPLDLSRAWLRAVSPVHIEYLKNMGVRASMSVSLLREGRLWGLIACHHYTSAHEPDYETCATIELLAQLVSSRVVDRLQHERDQRMLGHRATLAALSRQADAGRGLFADLLDGDVALQDLIGADGAAVVVDGRLSTTGLDVAPELVAALAARAGDGIGAWDALGDELDGVPTGAVAGALVVSLGSDGLVLWLRREVAQHVDWGGDPHNKVVFVQEPDGVRIGPRQSFDRWREEIRGRSLPWTEDDLEAAGLIRTELIEKLYTRARRAATEALSLQLSLLPDRLPALDGWGIAARYLPTEGGRIGGDWYDALRVSDACLAVVIGDVTGHGVAAAGTMAQLRNALRAYLLDDADPARALERLDRMVTRLLPDEFATCLAALVDLETGVTRLASYGHLPPLLVGADGAATFLDPPRHPSLGLADLHPTASTSEFTIDPGGSLVIVTDGIVERRRERLDDGFERLRRAGEGPGGPAARCDAVVGAARDPTSDDDATVLVLQRAATP